MSCAGGNGFKFITFRFLVAEMSNHFLEFRQKF